MLLNSKNFIDTYINMICEESQLSEDKKKKMVVKQVGAPIEERPTPQEPDFGGGDVGGAEGGACCGEQKQVNEQDVSPKDAFLSMLYDLIDTAYALGQKAAQDGTDYPPMEDKEVNDILGSIEAAFDEGRQVQIQQIQDTNKGQPTQTTQNTQLKTFIVTGRWKSIATRECIAGPFVTKIKAINSADAVNKARKLYSDKAYVLGAIEA